MRIHVPELTVEVTRDQIATAVRRVVPNRKRWAELAALVAACLCLAFTGAPWSLAVVAGIYALVALCLAAFDVITERRSVRSHPANEPAHARRPERGAAA